MLTKNISIFDKKVLTGLIFSSILSLLVFFTLPVQGLTLSCFALFTWLLFLSLTFVGLHKLLQLKEPISRENLNKYFSFAGFSAPVKPKQKVTPKVQSETLKRLVSEIDQYFISKWYLSISGNTDFVLESQVFLEEVLMRLVNLVLQIDHVYTIHGLLNIYLRHLKEFRRSLKRKKKYNIRVEDLYRYSQWCSAPANNKTKEYFLYQLTAYLLQHFINSELWNSLPCHILISILSRKLLRYLLNSLANPEVLNYMILTSLATNKVKAKLQLEKYGRIAIEEFFDVVEGNEKNINSDNNTPNPPPERNNSEDFNQKVQELQQNVENATKLYHEEFKASEEKFKKVTYRQRKRTFRVDNIQKSPKKSDPVKIYESRTTTQTWRDSRDLACVSLGQDPLDQLIEQANETSTFPKEVPSKLEENKHDSSPSAATLLNEVMNITSMEGLKTSIKPFSDATERTFHNIKDLQEATVNNALHKIGDFQDEAAGMVEGILDFGRAGFRKGLRLTGLHDNIENAKTTMSTNTSSARNVTNSVKQHVKKKLEELKRSSDTDSQEKMSSAESAGDSIWINPLESDSPNYDGHILLEKESIKSDNTSSMHAAKIEDSQIPSISTEEASESESPDPEYEDTADLASSIAKLRSLLQQRSESNLSTPSLSPMPDDYLQKQGESENVSDTEAIEVDGMMPSFYKFCTKTASGVLSNTINTIKTALPGGSSESFFTVELWKFTTDQKESETLTRMKKLLTERKEYCVLDKEIDTGYDVLDSVDLFQQSPILISNLPFEDEFDEFEGKMPITKALIDIVCELLADTDSPLIQEPIVRALLLGLGPVLEAKVAEFIDRAKEFLADNLVRIPETTKTDVLSMNIDDYIESIAKSSPELVKCIIGCDNYKASLKLFVSSVQKMKINEDVLLQAFELIAMKIVEEGTQVSPPVSA